MILNDNEENVRLIREYERNWKESIDLDLEEMYSWLLVFLLEKEV